MNRVTSQLSIVWIPGHSGIKGNDCADRLAKESLEKPAVDVVVSSEAREAFDAVDDYILQKGRSNGTIQSEAIWIEELSH